METTINFTTYNEAFSAIEVSTLDAWIMVYNGWVEVQEDLTKTAFGEAWAKAGSKKSATTVRISLGYVETAVAKGWLEKGTVGDWASLVAKCNPKQAHEARKAEAQSVTIEKVEELANKLSTRDMRKLLNELAAQLGYTLVKA